MYSLRLVAAFLAIILGTLLLAVIFTQYPTCVNWLKDYVFALAILTSVVIFVYVKDYLERR